MFEIFLFKLKTGSVKVLMKEFLRELFFQIFRNLVLANQIRVRQVWLGLPRLKFVS